MLARETSDISDLSGYRIVEEKTGLTVAEAPCSPDWIAQGYVAASVDSDGLGQQTGHWGHPSYVMLRSPTRAELFGLGEYNIEAPSGAKIAVFRCKPSRVSPGIALKRVLRGRSRGPSGYYPMFQYRDRYNWGLRTSRR